MKTFLGGVALLLLAGALALGASFRPEVLPTGSTDGVLVVPPARPPAGMSLALADTGQMLSQAGFAYRGGDLAEPRVFGMAAAVVRHPQGVLLIDAGFGRNVDAHLRTIPWLMRVTTQYTRATPVADQLRAAGIEPARLKGVLLTHAHWDHVSGLDDLRGVPVLLPQAELDFIRDGGPATALARSLGDLDYRVYGFEGPEYLGFAASHDVFGDGSVVVVPAPGHTPGSVIVFVTLPGERRYAFVGDLVWQREGVQIPAQRPWLSRRLADWDEAQVRARIVQLHRLAALLPGLVIVPAHDARVHRTLPALSATPGTSP